MNTVFIIGTVSVLLLVFASFMTGYLLYRTKQTIPYEPAGWAIVTVLLTLWILSYFWNTADCVF
jgi:high-affinity nickel permease